jgi:hypothetical protein
MVAALETQRRAVSDQELMLLSRVLRVTPSLLLAFESECIKICPYQAENERLLTQLRRLKLLPAE